MAEEKENTGKTNAEAKTEEAKKERVEKPKEETKETKPRNYWAYSTVIFAILLVVSLGMQMTGMLVAPDSSTLSQTTNQNQITPDAAGEKAVEFINKFMLGGGTTASMVSVADYDSYNLYNLTIEIEGIQYSSFVTKDGLILFPNGYDIDEMTRQLEVQMPEEPEPQPSETPKTDRPVMDVFIMSYCPYGLQMQKAVLPVMELLGDKADITIKWVSYAMHGKEEIDENTRQYCIQLEQSDKYIAYANCFTASGDVASCLTEAGIDTSALDSCIATADEEFSITGLYEDKSTWTGSTCPDPPYCFPLYMVDAKENTMFGVSGSPTVVLNGNVIQVTRSPDAVKNEICNAFITPPEECLETLSTAQASPGFGSGTGDSSGSCS